MHLPHPPPLQEPLSYNCLPQQPYARDFGGMLADKGYEDLWPVIVSEEKVMLDVKNPEDITFMKKYKLNGFEPDPLLRPRKYRKAKANDTAVARKSPKI